jgi:cytosine/adenosine deaminase-related metal-dependent hydrolase
VAVEQVVVVRGGHLLTMGPAGDLEDGAVAFAAGEVLAVGPFAEVAARFPGAEVVGDGHGVVLPGLVNAHTHLSEALLPGMLLGSGVCPLAALRGAGIPVGIGTDGPASNDSQNMLEAVKAAALLHKLARLDPRAVTAGDVLAMATIEGARALGLDGRIGSLEPGKRADVVRLRGDRPGLANVHDPRQQVVYCASVADVADVWVDGARRVMDGHLVDHDLAALVEASRPLAADLVTRAGLQGFSWLAGPQSSSGEASSGQTAC